MFSWSDWSLKEESGKCKDNQLLYFIMISLELWAVNRKSAEKEARQILQAATIAAAT